MLHISTYLLLGEGLNMTSKGFPLLLGLEIGLLHVYIERSDHAF